MDDMLGYCMVLVDCRGGIDSEMLGIGRRYLCFLGFFARFESRSNDETS